MEDYCEEVRHLEDKFYGLELNHIAQQYNSRCELAKIASERTKVPLNVFSRGVYESSVMIDESPEPSPGTKTPSATKLEAM
jgi:hypothetical protein